MHTKRSSRQGCECLSGRLIPMLPSDKTSRERLQKWRSREVPASQRANHIKTHNHNTRSHMQGETSKQTKWTGGGCFANSVFFFPFFFYGARTTSRAKSCRTWRMPHLISARKSKDCRTQENHGLAQKTLTFYKLAGKRMMLWSVMQGRKAPSRTSRHTLSSSHNKNEQMQLHKHARQRWDAD